MSRNPSAHMPLTAVREIEEDGVQVFYRAAGDPDCAGRSLATWIPDIVVHVPRTHSTPCRSLPGNRAGSTGFRIYGGAGGTKIYLLVRSIGRNDRSLHGSTQNK